MKKSKTIAVNTRFLLHNRLEGIGRFTTESLKRIVKQHPEHHFIFLFDRPAHKSFIFAENVTAIELFPPARHPFLWFVWFEIAVARYLKKINADIFVSTDGYCCLNTKTPTLMVMHDLAFEHYPEQVPFLARHYYRFFSPKYARKAKRLATVSEYTKQDIVKLYGISPDLIDVVYNGANDIYKPLKINEKEKIKAKYSDNQDYFLFIGAIHPRKNLGKMLKAFDIFKEKTKSNTKFLVAGRKAWQSKTAFETFQNMKHKNEVVFLGHLQLEELAKVLAAALALVYASLFEGFGIPIVEAFRCETPVITSNVSSMTEIGGNAALLVSPESENEIFEAMLQIFENENLRQDLIAKGRLQGQKFSWQQTADKLWQSIEKML
jgi:glycosyltransferase involved in cell wall biosynthesis